MAVVKCGSLECKHRNDSGICQKSNITLSDCYYHTVYDGFQHGWRCKQYEESEVLKSIKEAFRKLEKEMERGEL